MQSRHVSFLVAAALAAVILSWILISVQQEPTPAPPGRLFPQLGSEPLATVRLTDGVDQVNLHLQEEQWTVAELFDYPADFNKLRQLVQQIQDTRADQTFEVIESRLAPLQLLIPDWPQAAQSPESTEGRGIRLQLINRAGQTEVDVILGRLDESTSGKGGMPGFPRGRYLRLADRPDQIILTSQTFEGISVKPSDWLRRELIDVRLVRSVQVTPYGSRTPRWKLARSTRSGEFEFVIPRSWKVDPAKTGALRNLLSSSRLESVLGPVDEVDLAEYGLDKPLTAVVETFEGFRYTLLLGQKTASNQVPLKLSVQAQFPSERERSPDENESTAKDLDEAFAREQKELKERLEKQRAQEKWVFLVPDWAVNVLFEKREAFRK